MKLSDLNEFKCAIARYNGDAQVISRESFVRARTNVSIMTIENTEDAFLYYASLNLLNAYVKQNKKEISYGFKQEVTSGFDAIINNKVSGVTYNYDAKEKVLVVDVAGLQFSFHNILPSAKMDFVKNFDFAVKQNYCHNKGWDGLRLQPCAETIFAYASALEGLSKETFAGNLKDIQEAQIEADKEKANGLGQMDK